VSDQTDSKGVHAPGDATAQAGTLLIVGTGIQWAGQTTLAARGAIERADRVFYAVADPLAARWIKSLNASAEALPYPRDGRPRRSIYQEMTDLLLAAVRQGQRVCAVFYGHPGVLANTPHQLLQEARREGLSVRMLPGVSALDCLYTDLGVDPGRDGCQVYEATDFLLRSRLVDARVPLILCQVGLIGEEGVFDPSRTERIRSGLTVLAEVLGRHYPADTACVLYEAATHPLEPARMERVALRALADAPVSAVSTLYVPPRERTPVDPAMRARLGLRAPEPDTEPDAEPRSG